MIHCLIRTISGMSERRTAYSVSNWRQQFVKSAESGLFAHSISFICLFYDFAQKIKYASKIFWHHVSKMLDFIAFFWIDDLIYLEQTLFFGLEENIVNLLLTFIAVNIRFAHSKNTFVYLRDQHRYREDFTS